MKATLSLGTAGERIQPQSGPAPPVSPGVDINMGAQGEGGREGMFSYLHSPTPQGSGRAERGGDSQASNSCISHGTAAVRASWEQCPARGNRSNTRDWWERSSSCWPGTDRELLPAPAPQEGIAAAPAFQRTLPSPCSRGLHSLLSLPGCGLWLPSYGSIPIPYPSLSASDLLSGQCS